MVKKAIVKKPAGTKPVIKKPVVGKPKTKVQPEVEEEIEEDEDLEEEELDEDEIDGEEEIEEDDSDDEEDDDSDDEDEDEESDEEDDEEDSDEDLDDDGEDDEEEEEEPDPKKKAPVKAPVKKSPVKKATASPAKKAPVKKVAPTKKTSAVANKEDEAPAKKNSKFGPRKNAPKKEKSYEIEELGSFTVDGKKKYMQNAIAESMIKHNIFGAKDYSEDVEDIIKELSLSFTKDIIDAFDNMYNEAFEKHCKISIGKANFVLRKLKAKVMKDNPVMNGRNVIVPPTYKMVASVLEKKDVIDCQKKGNDLYVVDGKKKTKVTDEYIKELNEEFFGEEEE